MDLDCLLLSAYLHCVSKPVSQRGGPGGAEARNEDDTRRSGGNSLIGFVERIERVLTENSSIHASSPKRRDTPHTIGRPEPNSPKAEQARLRV